MKQKIKEWICSQELEEYLDGVLHSDFAEYTKLGEMASAHFEFEENSQEDELCFELAIELLDIYIEKYKEDKFHPYYFPY